MARDLFGLGLLGVIAEDIQRALLASGHDPKGLDGVYGQDTLAAVRSFQVSSQLPATGVVDEATWQALLKRPVPGTDLRSLSLTSAFEGHGYTLALGNWDGAWLTWGILGFTMKHGEVQKIILNANANNPQFVRDAFGEDGDELLRVMDAPPDTQEQWASTITTGVQLAEPWRAGFARLGSYPEIQAEQQRRARQDYFLPALQTARSFHLKSELGLALSFDIHVQNGGVSAKARQLIQNALNSAGPAEERWLRQTIANAVADTARATFREDVRRRKLAIANGEGEVHGRKLLLANWGLGEEPAPELP